MHEYQPRRRVQHLSLPIDGIDYRLNLWGDAEPVRLVALHGWGDAGMSFQFLADQLPTDISVLAPDWRGFGASESSADRYYFPDYLADLDAVLTSFSPAKPVVLLGHSLGGNVASLYAGVRPERVRALIVVEGFGLTDSEPDAAPARYARWLASLTEPTVVRDFAAPAELAERIRRRSPGLTPDRALFLARHWTRANGDAHRLRLAGAHRRPNPVLYRRAEARACWQAITAPVTLVRAEPSTPGLSAQAEDMAAALGEHYQRTALIADSGHNIHLEQPGELAGVVAQVLGDL